MKRITKLLLLLCFTLYFVPAQATPSPLAYVAEINGAIGPATSAYFIRALREAENAQAQFLLLKLDTPGGLDTSMRAINKAILSSNIPVVTFVAPDGARAASAGTYILYASHIAVMAPATNLGAATPVQIGKMPGIDKAPDKAAKEKQGPSNQESLRSKAINDARAYIRSLAIKRGRNVQWAELAVVKAESLPAQEALKLGVINLIADNTEDLMRQLAGYQVKVLGENRTLQTAGIEIRPVPMGWRFKLLSAISNPNIAYILLMIGIYGLIFEFMNPGYFLPGVAGAICLLLGLYALHLLPINYSGAALLLLGIALMITEAFVPSFGALGIGGVVAFVFGSILLIDTKSVPGLEISRTLIASVAVVSSAFFILVVGMAIKARRRKVVSGAEEMIGAEGEVLEDIEATGNVFVHSEIWEANSLEPLKKGTRIRVLNRKGLVLTVEPVHPKQEVD